MWSRDGSSYSQEDFGQTVVLSQAGGQLFISVLERGVVAVRNKPGLHLTVFYSKLAAEGRDE